MVKNVGSPLWFYKKLGPGFIIGGGDVIQDCYLAAVKKATTIPSRLFYSQC